MLGVREMVPSWERITGKWHSSVLIIPPYHCPPWATTELRRGVEKEVREEGREGRNSSFNAKVLLEQCVWLLQGAIFILKGKHAAIKLF